MGRTGRDGVAEAFGCEGGGEALSQSIVIGIGGAAHVKGEAVGGGEIMEVGGGVLDAAITGSPMASPRFSPPPPRPQAFFRMSRWRLTYSISCRSRRNSRGPSAGSGPCRSTGSGPQRELVETARRSRHSSSSAR